jgi:hypothetical protein
MLVVSSTDGYCSIVTFAVGELGIIYEPTKDMSNKEKADKESARIEPVEGSGNSSEKTVVCEDTGRAELSEGAAKLEGFLDIAIIAAGTQETHSSDMLDTPALSCASDKMMDSHKCDKASGKSDKPLISEEIEVSSSPEEKPENIKISDLQKTESFRTNFCGTGESLSKQEKTPRRIKPVLLSSPRKVSAKPSHSSDIPERKKKLSSLRIYERMCPIMSNKSSCYKSNEVTKLGDISDANPSERIHPSLSQCSPKVSVNCNRPSKSSSCIKPLSSSEKTFSIETTKMDDSRETMKCSDMENEMSSPNEPMRIETDPVAPEYGDATALRCTKPADATVPSSEPECMEVESNGSLFTKSQCASNFESTATSATSPASPLTSSIIPGQDKKTPRRVQLITLASPKSKKKLL